MKPCESKRNAGLIIGVCLCLLAAGGCYQHVVRAEGASPGRYDIHEPNLKLEEEQPVSRREAREQAAANSKKKFLGLF
jgi:hypothetical protein